MCPFVGNLWPVSGHDPPLVYRLRANSYPSGRGFVQTVMISQIRHFQSRIERETLTGTRWARSYLVDLLAKEQAAKDGVITGKVGKFNLYVATKVPDQVFATPE
jgi:hypothetical protein